jgi:ATP-binding cassette subfamily B protein
MDCGPAALKCLLEGHGISVSYGRLREACQTDVDGTSIDTLEDIAHQLGLEAEQAVIPVDHLMLDEAHALPALVVVRQPNGFTHFVVVWRRHGSLVQVMDPAYGRRWIPRERFLTDVYVHEASVPLQDLASWVESDELLVPLAQRMRLLGVAPLAREGLLEAARGAGWRAIATLDAAVRMIACVTRAGALRRGGETERAIRAAIEDPKVIPPASFTALHDPSRTTLLRGAVILRVTGLRARSSADRADDSPAISPELAGALAERTPHPLRAIGHMLRAGGVLTPAVLLGAVVFTSVGTIVEAGMLRAALDLPHYLGTVHARLGAAALLVAWIGAARALDGPVAGGTLRIGRQIEARLRIAFFEKLPRLADRYFQSRPVSDMAERAHAIHAVHELPQIGAQLLKAIVEIAVTGLAIAWLYPDFAPIALAASVLALVVPLAWQPAIVERDMRVRTHSSAITRIVFDALLGLMPIRTHGAEIAMRREHESFLSEWGRASHELARAGVWAEAVQALVTVFAVVWMVTAYVARSHDTAGVLLLVYFSLNMPALSAEIALQLRRYPSARNVTLRLLDPLGAFEDGEPTSESPSPQNAVEKRTGGVEIEMEGVSVVAAGHVLVRDIDLRIQPGEHVAVVGASGAGKSTLAGLLLGWHRAATGRLLVDGEPLSGPRLDDLRRGTAWIDPGIQIWNRSLLENLRYGTEDERGGLARVLESADIAPLLDRLPDGMQTTLGEGGALVSGGEGQRVRLGRAMMREKARLVILDEAFRGLDRTRRRELLARVRAFWKDTTLLCISHDIAETMAFDRVLVLEGGTVVEDGAPTALSADETSRYGAMLRAERSLLDETWGAREWRRLRLERGRIVEPLTKSSSPPAKARPARSA